MNTLYYAHSGLRYLVLFTALAALIALAYSMATGRAKSVARKLSTTFAALLDLQIVLGIALLMGGIFPDIVTGHLLLMVFAAVVTHGAFLIGQHVGNDRRELGMRLGGIVVALALIVMGIMALGRTVLGSAPPPVAYSYGPSTIGTLASGTSVRQCTDGPTMPSEVSSSVDIWKILQQADS